MKNTRDAEWTRVMAEYGPALSRLARTYTHTAADADDLLQEVAFALWKALPGYRRECSERTFVYRVAHNRASTWRRSQGRHKNNGAIDEQVPDPAPWADADVIGRYRAERLRRAVRQLPASLEQVVVLRLEGLRDAEIAEVTGLSDANVAVRLTRARAALRGILGEDP